MTDSLDLPNGPWPTLEPGWVWLCGAGPGDPGLLTLHALNALRQADVVIYDALVEPRILDWAPQAEHIYAGKRGGKPSAVQRDISLRLVDLAAAGKRVLRLKGGDPFVFGRGGEEAQTLVQHGVSIRIIPGISAGIGGLDHAELGIPTRQEAVDRYVARTGYPVPPMDWYFAYNLFRLAGIMQGIKKRVIDGTASSAHAKAMSERVVPLVQRAHQFALDAGMPA